MATLAEQEGAAFEEIEINFRETVQPSAGVRVTNHYFLPGTITKVMFSFPPGTNALVDARLEKDGHGFYPVRGHLALDNATPVYHTSAGYYAKEPLTFEVRNRDGINPHTITCTVVVRFQRPRWWR